MYIIIGNVHQFIGHCFVTVDPCLKTQKGQFKIFVFGLFEFLNPVHYNPLIARSLT